jgi:Na+/H+-dicarboxylate symporter
VTGPQDSHETPKWRTFWLLAAFALLIGIGVATVLLPELEDEQTDPENPAEQSESDSEPQE